MKFKIFHPKNGELNITATLGKYYYVLIGEIESDDIHNLYSKLQNDFSPEYRAFEVRSTSVGDVVYDGFTYFMYLGMGVKEVQEEDLRPTLMFGENF